jgi:hypothetical protein
MLVCVGALYGTVQSRRSYAPQHALMSLLVFDSSGSASKLAAQHVTTEIGNSIEFSSRIVPCHMPRPLAHGGTAEPFTGVTEISLRMCG